MALTVFETAEQVHPCNAVEQQGCDGGKVAAAAAEKAAVKLKETDHDDNRPERADIWNMIQAQKPAPTAAPKAAYVHPLVRRSSSLLTQKSLETCTESLGSETGSDGFSDAATDRSDDDDGEHGAEEDAVRAARAPPPPPPPSWAFPPPLPSLARRTVTMGAMEMRQHRSDGRLVVQAVPVPSPTLFRAQRSGGRLLLSFADTPASEELDNEQNPTGHVAEPDEQRAHEEEEEEEEEEEVEVVDRGTVVEFKVSTQPQARSGSGSRVHRSALVINKFVGAEPAAAALQQHQPPRPPRRPTGSTTTAIAALAAASALSAAAAAPAANGREEEDVVPSATLGENKLLMTAARRRRSKEELLKHMRRCGQLSGKLFIWEEPRIATSS